MFTSPTGHVYRYDIYKKALDRAFKKAGLAVPEGFRRCHDLRVTAITNDAIAGAHPIAVMTKAATPTWRRRSGT